MRLCYASGEGVIVLLRAALVKRDERVPAL